MILKGVQCFGGRQFVIYLFKIEDNEYVEVYELWGFMFEDLFFVFNEIYVVSKGICVKQLFFFLSFSLLLNECVLIEVFEMVIEQIEQKFGLEDQFCVVVFYEKEGCRYVYVVWLRIDIDEMKVINLFFYKMKLKDLFRELYLEYGWKILLGIVDCKDWNLFNFSCEEW